MVTSPICTPILPPIALPTSGTGAHTPPTNETPKGSTKRPPVEITLCAPVTGWMRTSAAGTLETPSLGGEEIPRAVVDGDPGEGREVSAARHHLLHAAHGIDADHGAQAGHHQGAIRLESEAAGLVEQAGGADRHLESNDGVDAQQAGREGAESLFDDDEGAIGLHLDASGDVEEPGVGDGRLRSRHRVEAQHAGPALSVKTIVPAASGANPQARTAQPPRYDTPCDAGSISKTRADAKSSPSSRPLGIRPRATASLTARG